MVILSCRTSGILRQTVEYASAAHPLSSDDDISNDDVAVDYPDPVSDKTMQSVGKWPNPTIVVGLPKAGTSSLAEYFRCGGVEKVAHYMCLARACGAIIKQNIMSGRNPLFRTGRANVYSQIDVELNVARGMPCYFPQVEALEEIHKAHPNSTFVLNQRNVDDWVKSVQAWARMDHRLALCNITGLPAGQGRHKKELKFFYASQVSRVRRFVAKYPSHRLVEVVIDSPDAGQVLESAFGISKRCWGHHNRKLD